MRKVVYRSKGCVVREDRKEGENKRVEAKTQAYASSH